jgi:hypothetical protein
MLDAGQLVVAGPTGSLLERTGTLTVDVGNEGEALIRALATRSLAATAVGALVEVQVDDEAGLDVVRDVVAELGLPLHRMTTHLTSLDDVFLDRAGHGGGA